MSSVAAVVGGVLIWGCIRHAWPSSSVLLQRLAACACATQGRTALHEACRSGKVSVVKLFLQKAKGKVRVDATDSLQWTPLHVAVYHGFDEVSKLLLLANASISINTLDNETPRCLAARMAQAGYGPFRAQIGTFLAIFSLLNGIAFCPPHKNP